MNSFESAAAPKILVTGLNGLIGWNLFVALSKRFETFGTYRQPHARLPSEKIFRLEMENEEELTRLLLKIRPNYLIHAWAMCDLDLCEQFPEMAARINIQGAKAILNAAARIPEIRKFIYLSTDHVFDGERGGYHEDETPVPKHVYGHTKLEAEKCVAASGLDYAIVRPGLVIGGSMQGSKGPRDFLYHRAGKGKTTHYFTDEWRSPLDAFALAEKVLEILFSNEQGIFHVAGERIFNRYELALQIALSGGFPSDRVMPRLRSEDRWASIRPKDLSLKSNRFALIPFHPHKILIPPVSVSLSL